MDALSFWCPRSSFTAKASTLALRKRGFLDHAHPPPRKASFTLHPSTSGLMSPGVFERVRDNAYRTRQMRDLADMSRPLSVGASQRTQRRKRKLHHEESSASILRSLPPTPARLPASFRKFKALRLDGILGRLLFHLCTRDREGREGEAEPECRERIGQREVSHGSQASRSHGKSKEPMGDLRESKLEFGRLRAFQVSTGGGVARVIITGTSSTRATRPSPAREASCLPGFVASLVPLLVPF